ncbi:hypothetical protein [Cupriavidus sp. D39]|uniref:hypothetical protein n=1 Tax=Cupriavidus sp. D39 TaxID=2997877 RepID=UPI00226DE03B|nr:hypothetical protein [Cupriavidus sp. D39]MCY0853950.1 hypothetical protein [Cupriavidus sp. D39]
MRNTKTDSRYASASEIREIIGPFEGEVIARILEIEPTLEAFPYTEVMTLPAVLEW